jgi:stage II sporulation protein AA (anti-sigma F factor antagonist)
MELAGELNMATAPQVTHHLESDLVVPDHLIVDLTRVTFMDSTGLMVLLSAYDEVEGRISVVAPTPPVQKVLDISGTSVLFHVAPDRATAATYLHTAS